MAGVNRDANTGLPGEDDLAGTHEVSALQIADDVWMLRIDFGRIFGRCWHAKPHGARVRAIFGALNVQRSRFRDGGYSGRYSPTFTPSPDAPEIVVPVPDGFEECLCDVRDRGISLTARGTKRPRIKPDEWGTIEEAAYAERMYHLLRQADDALHRTGKKLFHLQPGPLRGVAPWYANRWPLDIAIRATDYIFEPAIASVVRYRNGNRRNAEIVVLAHQFDPNSTLAPIPAPLVHLICVLVVYCTI